MAELTPIWNNATLTAATLPPSFAISNSPNAQSCQINNQSGYWLIVYKTNSNVSINRIEPYSYLTFPYEADISIRIDTSAGKVTTSTPVIQFVDYTTFDYYVGYAKGSTFFSGAATVDISGGSVDTNVTNPQLTVAQVYNAKATFTVPAGTSATNYALLNFQFLPNGTMANVHHVDFYITSAGGWDYGLASASGYVFFADGTSRNANSNWGVNNLAVNALAADGNAVICNNIQFQLYASGTLASPDTITVYFTIDTNETSIGTLDGVPVKNHSAQINDASGSITGTSIQHQQVLGYQIGRRYLFFQNLSSTDMYLGIGTSIYPSGSPTPGTILVPANGGSFTMEGVFCTEDYIFVGCATTGAQFTCKYY